MADLLIRCHKRDRALSLELAGNLAGLIQSFSTSWVLADASPSPAEP
jgi:hypothetical protein